MAADQGFCSSCNRTVFISVEDDRVCPVCSSPLVERIKQDDPSFVAHLRRASDQPASQTSDRGVH